MRVIIVIALLLGVHILLVNSDNPKVKLPDGFIQGVVLKDYDGSKYYGFRSIPYAKPPIGKYRFRAAVKNSPWNHVLNASALSPLCLQPNEDKTIELGNEDCLYLNVYTPTLDPDCLKPVMVYIHGGGFITGYASAYGADYLMPEDIVLVTINYRLGVYGFINLVDNHNEKELVPNNGFKDQVLALKWVQKNIRYFGGNPEQVTIAGQSVGGMSVHSHILSPLSKGLFHGAIQMSGSAIHTWAYCANNTAIAIAKYLNIDTSNKDSMINELKLASHEQLYHAATNLLWFRVQLDLSFRPGLFFEKPGPNSFITTYPLNIIKSGNYNKVPMLLGNTDREGIYIRGIKEEYVLELKTHIPFFFKNKLAVEKEVINYYNINTTSDYNNITMYGDVWFKFNAIRAALEHTKIEDNKDVYYYEFSGYGTLNVMKYALNETQYEGACHADDLGYLFMREGFPLATKGSIEEKLMRMVTSLFGNFVKTGKPYKKWLPFTPNTYNLVNITNDGLKVGHANSEPFKFWLTMYEKYSNGLN